MKLNIGCGKIYKDGFINLDAFDSTVADRIMTANDLKFPSNTIEQIQACQLIEHFGLIKTLYVLAEWFRVLKPGGKLLIETPDLEKSFKDFIKGDIETRKNILTWIYGTDALGMSHLFCFPTDLLEMLLRKTGFSYIKKSFYEKEKNHPTQRIICKKAMDSLPLQIISTYRKKLLNKKIVDYDKYYIALEQEKLIDFFIEKIKQFYKSKKIGLIDDIVINGAIKNVKMTKLFLEECVSHKIISKNKLISQIETLDFLKKIEFPSLLFHLIKESSEIVGAQKKTYTTVCNVGKESIKKLLSIDKEKSKVKESLLKFYKKSNTNDIIFFSYDLLERKASEFFYKGIKEFTIGNYNNAINYLREAIKIDRNHLIYFWNLARLLSLSKKVHEAKRIYKNAIDLVDLSELKLKKKLKTTLEKEMTSFSQKEHGKPLTEIK
ncbi:MAG: methyltransferase domain-containing protein [Thermoplasmatales archaeon]|nr:MAG: methyltransferase domain-containing protein [Thermoplasmatales archaeon]